MPPDLSRPVACLLLALLGAAGAAAAEAAEGTPDPLLPSIECVEELRRTRLLAEPAGAEARRRLLAAADLPGCELPALSELLGLVRLGGVPPAEATALRRRLAERLQDAGRRVPVGILRYLAAPPGDPADDEAVLAALEARLAGYASLEAPAPAGEVEAALAVAADLQERLDRPEAARDTLARLLARRPDDEVLRWRALVLDQRLERWESAAALLAGMVDEPEAPEVLRQMYVATLARLGRTDEMLRQLERLEPREPREEAAAEVLDDGGFVHLVMQAAWNLRDAGRDAEAEALFRRALALQPELEEARLAVLHLYASEEERAAHAATVAERRQAETEPTALYEEGSRLLAAGDAATAIELLRRAAPHLEETPFAEAAWYNLGLAAYQLQRWEEAAAALGRAAEINPARADTFFQRGLALHQLDRCAEAVPALRRALELQPSRRPARYYLAECLETLGDAAAAARERELYRAAGDG